MKYKNVIFVMIVFVIVTLGTSCGVVWDVITDTNASLRIINLTPYDVDYVSWEDRYGQLYYFGDDMVWDEVEQDNILGISSGHSSMQMVSRGESPIYFYFTTDAIKFRTAEEVEVETFDSVDFSLGLDTEYNLVLSGISLNGSTNVYNLIPVEGSRDLETLK